MLCSFVEEYEDSWDQGLDIMMFAYREVPIANYGYSPFELLYGRCVISPLQLVYDNWWYNNKAEVSEHVVSYLLRIRERM